PGHTVDCHSEPGLLTCRRRAGSATGAHLWLDAAIWIRCDSIPVEAGVFAEAGGCAWWIMVQPGGSSYWRNFPGCKHCSLKSSRSYAWDRLSMVGRFATANRPPAFTHPECEIGRSP